MFVTEDRVYSSPAVADVDYDGQVEVYFGSWDYKIYCVDGATGAQKWSIPTMSGYIFSSATICNLDGAGPMEIVIGSHDNKLYCLNGVNGNTKWEYSTSGQVSSPSKS